MIHRIGWINNQWGPFNDLAIPISDRGLNLGDGIFETIFILKGYPILFREHLQRMRQCTKILGMNKLPSSKRLESLIKEGIDKANLKDKNGVVRLNWSRGDSIDRGIGIPKNSHSLENRLWLEINTCEPSFNFVSTLVSQQERRNPDSKISRCKTFSYLQGIVAKEEAIIDGADDALLLNTRGEMCCGTTANLIIRRQGQWLTPELESGCLPGIMRQEGINAGIFKESKIKAEPNKDDQWLLINSLGCKPIKELNKKPLLIYEQSEKLWFDLINRSFRSK